MSHAHIEAKATYDTGPVSFWSTFGTGGRSYVWEVTATINGIQAFATGSDMFSTVKDAINDLARKIDRHPDNIKPQAMIVTFNERAAGTLPTGIIDDDPDDDPDDDDVFTIAGVNQYIRGRSATLTILDDPIKANDDA